MSGNVQGFNGGDRVYIYSAGYGAISKGIISRVTKTQAIITHARYEQRFNRQTGRLVGGGSFESTSISHPTERLDREWHAQKIRAARRELAEIARGNNGDDGSDLRAAFEKWDRLESETE